MKKSIILPITKTKRELEADEVSKLSYEELYEYELVAGFLRNGKAEMAENKSDDALILEVKTLILEFEAKMGLPSH